MAAGSIHSTNKFQELHVCSTCTHDEWSYHSSEFDDGWGGLVLVS